MRMSVAAILTGLVIGAVSQAQTPAAGEKVSLFDGKTLDGWVTGRGTPVTEGWEVQDGCIYRAGKGGDIFTAKEYSDFVFEFEWRISPKGNSGIKYRYTNYGRMRNGPEYQVLDNEGHPDANKGEGDRRAACLYDILKADTTGILHPAGEWNTGKIVARGSKVEHWLNGKLVLSYDSNTDSFREAVQHSKFKGTPDYAGKPSGRIMLQDHGNPVWYRNITIIDLSAKK